MRKPRAPFAPALLCLAGVLLVPRAARPLDQAPLLEEMLRAEDAVALARAARADGDPQRGALVFHQPVLACVKCHAAREGKAPVGPDLARPLEPVPDVHWVDSLLWPSKTIRKGYEAVTIDADGSGLLVGLIAEEKPDSLVLRDAARDFEPVAVAKARVRARNVAAASIMPEGLSNQLQSRQEFLDLVRYVMEVAEKGPARARELAPDPALLAPPPLPDYEKDIDHAGLIAALDRGSLRRGEAIYKRLCVNCHGTRELPGSLPTSLAFATGRFKNGSDAFSMYQTLTHGFGLMTPQGWMLPREKYDVIHYIREAYLKRFNPSQYAPAGADYLARLPKGTSRGPAPSASEPWRLMDHGRALLATYEVGRDGANFAHKGIAVRLDEGPGGVARGRFWMLYDHDTLRAAAAWSGERFMDWNGINFNGLHGVHPRIFGQVHFSNPTGPGWADPESGRFEDVRPRGRDGKRYGPLPRSWARYRGLYRFEDRVLLAYTVGACEVLESPGLARAAPRPVFTRSFRLGPRERDLILEVARVPGANPRLSIAETGGGERAGTAVIAEADPAPQTPRGRAERSGGVLAAGASAGLAGASFTLTDDGRLRLRIPAGRDPLAFTLWLARLDEAPEAAKLALDLAPMGPEPELPSMTRGGRPRWPERLVTRIERGRDDGPFAVDVLAHPERNPWACLVRFTGLDFLPGGDRLAACTWDGDVWLVEGIDRPEGDLGWRRIASGLFQPLGLKVVGGKIHITCRDQIVILHDLNGDGEADFQECFNSDHQVTEHFHEFAMDLETDAGGNFYYTKGARHALPAVVPHHGTLLRVSRDGSRTDILATGFRAPNGVCVNPDGTFFLTDQEGHWMPKNRINWVKPGGYYGNFFGYHDVSDPSDAAMEPPVAWITNRFDRSPSRLLWVESPAWGPLQGALLNLSYGYGKVHVVLRETVEGRMQGGMCALPIPQFPTGVMRGRFHPRDGQLYACGMFAWAGNQEKPGGLYRVRFTGKPLWVPLGLRARREGLEIAFTGRLDRRAAADPRSYALRVWSLKRSSSYGSEHIDERPLEVRAARLGPDGRTVSLEAPAIAPTQGMEIQYFLLGEGGERVDGVIHNTIHALSD